MRTINFIFSFKTFQKEAEEIKKLSDLGINPIIMESSLRIPKISYNPERRQYNVQQIFSVMNKMGIYPIIGVVDIDIFHDGTAFVFGVTSPTKGIGIISTKRLKQNYYGFPEDEELYMKRFRKELMHEIGHIFGLLHCDDAECVMFPSNSIKDVDKKNEIFCTDCFKFLKKQQQRV